MAEKIDIILILLRVTNWKESRVDSMLLSHWSSAQLFPVLRQGSAIA